MNASDLAASIAAARVRLMNLRERAARAPHGSSDVLTASLRELEDMLGQLAIAREELARSADPSVENTEHLLAEVQRFRQLFEHVPVGCFVTDAQGVIETANKRARQLFRIPDGWVSSRPLVTLVAAADVPELRQRLLDLGAGRAFECWHARIRPRGVDPPMTVSLSAKPLLNTAGAIDAIHWAIQPATDAVGPQRDGLPMTALGVLSALEEAFGMPYQVGEFHTWSFREAGVPQRLILNVWVPRQQPLGACKVWILPPEETDPIPESLDGTPVPTGAELGRLVRQIRTTVLQGGGADPLRGRA